jgi:hypothetical protein
VLPEDFLAALNYCGEKLNGNREIRQRRKQDFASLKTSQLTPRADRWTIAIWKQF